MPSISESRSVGLQKLTSGDWAYVPADKAAPPAIPAPNTAYPAAPNQYLRSPLPPDMWQDPDAQRQFHSAAIPQYRLAPLPANTNPVAGAQAASQAIQIVQNTPATSTASGVTSVGLTMPTALFVAPVTGSPITSAGTLAPVFANEPINTVFAGAPSAAGVVSVDSTATAAGVDPVHFSASVFASGANELVLTFVYPTGTLVPPAGFTSLGTFGSPSPYLGSKVTAAAGTVTAAGQAGVGSGAIWEQMLLAFKNTGSVPPTIRQVGVLSGLSLGTSSGNPFSSNVMASSSIVVFIYDRSGGGLTPSNPPAFTITDNQGGGTYVELTSVFNSTPVFPNQQSIFAQCFATPSVTAGTLTATVTNPLNGTVGWGAANAIFLEIVGLGSPIFTPTFRPLVAADIPNLDASVITTGKLALARGGTNADLSATGGVSNVLKQIAAGAAISVGQLAASDLSNGTTGTGAVVLASSPTITGTAALPTTTLTGKITNYNGVATVSNGIPSEYATVDLTAQTAAITTTTLYAVPANGQYRVSWNAKITTAAGSSSTLGALTIVYTDPDGVVQTITAAVQSNAGVIETSDSGNLTMTVLLGLPLLLNCKASTNVTYAMAYASNAAAAMNYNLHIKLEAM